MTDALTLARPYAKALFALATDDAAQAAWGDCLQALAAMANTSVCQRFVDSPVLTDTQKVQALAEAFSDVVKTQLSTEQQNFLQVLADAKRLNLLSDIAKQFEWLQAVQTGVAQVVVTTASDVKDKAALEADLQKSFDSDLTFEYHVDKNVMGGVVAQTHEKVWDDSIAGRLEKLKNALCAE